MLVFRGVMIGGSISLPMWGLGAWLLYSILQQLP
jgi:hypothetical protein